ncbi:MAG: DUF4091 domain-containing protein, partial [Candidatus Omnitrophica bacterium]|nr:DUF4091 domain-containing protein [Candidatus Omnitrophota bacterium]
VKQKEIKISLRVWDFTLPKYFHLRTAFDFYEYLVDLRTPRKDNESEQDYTERKEELKKNYYLDMLRHRINPIHNVGNPKFLGKKDNVYLLDFEEFDRKVEFYRNFGQTCFGIAQEWPYGYKGNWTDKWYGFKNAEAVEGVFREYGKHLEEKGWLDFAYAYIFDETFHRVKDITSLIHKGHPGIKNLLTMTPQEGYPDIDIWCVRINNIERKTVEDFRKKGKEIWMYIAGHTSPYPSLNLDLPSIEYRIIPWICWKYETKGLLYWCVNWWHNVDPWKDSMNYPGQNGNGCLYYPSLDGINPIGSIRLEILRDGLEDYEYLFLLKKLLERLKEKKNNEVLIKNIERILTLPKKVLRDAGCFSYSSKNLLDLRKKIGFLIENINDF